MPQDAFKYLAKLNKERKDAIYTYMSEDASERKKMFDKEAEFLELAKELAENPVVGSQVVAIIKNTEIDEDIRKMAGLVGFTIDNKEVWRGVVEIVTNKSFFIDLSDDVLSILPGAKQKEIVSLYVNEFASEISLGEAGDVIFKNGYIDLAEAYIDNGVLVETKGASYVAQQVQAMLALNNHPQVKLLLEEKYKNENNIHNRRRIAYKLVLAGSQLGFDYCRENAFDEKDLFGYVTRCGGPEDIELIKSTIQHESVRDYPADYLRELFWYGNPRAFPWLFEMLDHPESDIRVLCHRLMLDFFDEESELRREGEELLAFDEDEGDEPTNAKQYKDFWLAKKQIVNESIDKGSRYYGSVLFDMREIWDYEKYSPQRGFARDRCNNLMIWTGQYFAYDEHALISKQLEQHKVIADWLDANHTRFFPGKWFRWGKELT